MNYGQASDEEIERIILSEHLDEKALTEFISRVERKLKSIGRVLFNLKPDEIDELIEETQLLFWQRRATLTAGGLKYWFFQTMANKSMNYCRGRERFGNFRERTMRESQVFYDPSEHDLPLRLDLGAALLDLPESDQKLLYNLMVEGQTPTELALVMDLTPRAIRNRRENAIQKLRETMKER